MATSKCAAVTKTATTKIPQAKATKSSSNGGGMEKPICGRKGTTRYYSNGGGFD